MVFLGNGDGSFQTQSIGADDNYLSVGDFNLDGKLDFAAAAVNGNTVTVFLGNGDSTFQPGTSYNVGANPDSVTVADVNGDSVPDLVTGNYVGSNVSLLLGNGDGTFEQPLNFGTQAATAMAVAGDFNGDGKTDLAAISTKGVTVLINGSGGCRLGSGRSPRKLRYGDGFGWTDRFLYSRYRRWRVQWDGFAQLYRRTQRRDLLRTGQRERERGHGFDIHR